jgi:hypothetical protein
MSHISEKQLTRQIGLAMRIAVLAAWFSVLATWLLRDAFPQAGRGVFSIFRIVAILAIIWLVAESQKPSPTASDSVLWRSMLC